LAAFSSRPVDDALFELFVDDADLVFSPFLLLDVRGGSIPADDNSLSIACRHGASQEPAIGVAPGSAQAIFHLIGDASRPRRLKLAVECRLILGMDDLLDVGPLRRVQSGKLAPSAVEVSRATLGIAGPHDLRHGIGQLADTTVAFAQGFDGFLSIARVAPRQPDDEDNHGDRHTGGHSLREERQAGALPRF
jgi:hypothetical protein